jgi:hypothetical protein
VARNTWKVIVGSSIGVEVSRDEVDSVDQALAIVEQAMLEVVNDPGADISITFDDGRLDGVEV